MNPELVFHTSRLITDQEGMILNNKILHFLQPGMLVRVSYYVKNAPDCMWTNDAPYIKLEYVNLDDFTEPNELGGTVVEFPRKGNRSYPLNSNEYVKFTRDNVIEICDNNVPEHAQIFDEYRTEQTIPVTGPLYTVVWQIDEVEELSESGDEEPNSSEEDS